jgi:hypothetical protein
MLIIIYTAAEAEVVLLIFLESLLYMPSFNVVPVFFLFDCGRFEDLLIGSYSVLLFLNLDISAPPLVIPLEEAYARLLGVLI